MKPEAGHTNTSEGQEPDDSLTMPEVPEDLVEHAEIVPGLGLTPSELAEISPANTSLVQEVDESGISIGQKRRMGQIPVVNNSSDNPDISQKAA